MLRVLVVLALATLLAPASARASLLSAPRAPQLAGTTLAAGFAETTPWTVPDYVTAVRFAPDGHVFVAGKSGVIFEFDGPDDRTPTVFADLSKEVFDGWDRGLLGLAIDPRYDSGRPYIYVSYTYDKAPDDAATPRWSDSCPTPPGLTDGCVVTGRVSRLAPDGSETVLLEDFCDQSPSHSMGALEFGPDGALYAGAGDGASYSDVDYGQWGEPLNPCGDPPGGRGAVQAPPTAEGGALRAQSYVRPASQPASLDGAILRLDPDTGAALPDNPAPASADPVRRRILAYGLRNPFRFTFRPGTSELWVGDVGFGAWEEIDRVPDVSQVRDYGWPCYEGDVRQDGYEAVGLDACTSLYQHGGTVAPYFTYAHRDPLGDCPGGGSSISGIAFYDAAAFPAPYRGALLFADYSRGCIWAMLPGADGLPDPSTVQTLASGAAGPVDLEVGPDGALYYADVFDGEVRRITPVGGAPTARISAGAVAGDAPLTVHFDGTGSTAGVSYAWDLDGDGRFDDSTAAQPSFTYTHDGYVTVALRVTDAGGASGVATQRITVGRPPVPAIAAPSAAMTWAVGDTIGFSGSAVDGRGAPLPPSALRWSLDLRHCARTDPASCHTHRIADFAGAGSGSFVAPDHEYPSHLELTLTATDADGLAASRTVALMPKTATLTVTSTPPGARIGFGGDAATTPFTETVIAGSLTTLGAESPQSIGARSYVFGGWDDGGAATHAVRAPAAGARNVAVRFAAAPDDLLAGTDAVGDDVARGYPGRAEVYRLPPVVEAGTVMALRLRLDEGSTGAALVLGLYTEADAQNGRAGVLLGSGTLRAPVAGAWNEVRLDAPVTIDPGQRYWLGILLPYTAAGQLRWRDRAGRPDWEVTSGSLTLTGLPANWTVGLQYPEGGPVSGGAYGVSATFVPAPPEHVVAPTPAPAPAPSAPAPLQALPPLRVPARLHLHGRAVRIHLTCPTTCRFTATIAYRGHRLGRATKTGRDVTLAVTLSARGRRLVRAGRRLTVRISREARGEQRSASRTLRIRR